MTHSQKILAVPTNVITGFLGAGKTSAILQLLKQKPKGERWAVLVNEFGEIGVDGSLYKANELDNNNIFVEEVAGGCMCCASNVPMQIALNKLLSKAKPHRLFIEPTGLGHPVEVLNILSNQYYQDVLTLGNTLTLVDARHLSDSRYTKHAIFNEQIAIADIVIGNKADLYQPNDKAKLEDYLKKNKASANAALRTKEGNQTSPATLFFTEHGQIDFSLLLKTAHKSTLKSARKSTLKEQRIATDKSEQRNSQHSQGHSTDPHSHDPHSIVKRSHDHTLLQQARTAKNTLALPASGMIKAENQASDFKSVGWRFSSAKVFKQKQLHTFLNSVKAIRIKAVFITDNGCFSYNKAENELSEQQLSACNESRIEIINQTIEKHWQQQLLACIENELVD